MASFVSGSCRYLAWEDAKRSANETNNNAIILEGHHVPCSLSVTSSHKTLAFYARKSRGLYCQLVLCGIGFLFPKFGSNKKACHFVTPRQKREIAYTVSLKQSLKETKTWLGQTPYCVIFPRRTNTGQPIQSSVVKALPHFGPFAILENFLHSYHIIPCMTWISEVGILFKRKKVSYNYLRWKWREEFRGMQTPLP